MNKEELNDLLVRATECNNRKVINVNETADGTEFIIRLVQRRMSTIETSVYGTLENGSLRLTTGDEIGYGSWYDLDQEDLTEIQDYLNNIIRENAA